MNPFNRLFLITTCLLLAANFIYPSTSQARQLFKIASIAPDGSVWAKHFMDFAEEVEKKSKGEITFKVYPGGVMGDDTAVFRKMQIGQLNGGGFTMTGIGPVVSDFRVMGIPFLFNSYEEVDHVRQGLLPFFEKAFADKGLELIALTEVGFVYSMSTRQLTTLDDLISSKSWVPSDDGISATYLEQLGVKPIPLAIPDVLTGLQTGLIETVYNSLYGSIVLQWYTKARFVSDIPFGYAYGVFLMDKRSFSKLSKENALMFKETARKHFELLISETRKSNEDARQVLKNNNVRFNAPAPGELEQLQKTRDATVRIIQGSEISSEIYAKAIRLLKEYRAANP